MSKNQDVKELINVLKLISKTIDHLKYECKARQYTLNDDEFGSIMFCRDLADKAIKDLEFKDKNN